MVSAQSQAKPATLLGCYTGNFSPEALYKLYVLLIRPHLEYAVPPHLSKDIDKLEAVQMFALKMCSKDPDLLDHHRTPTLNT